MGQKRAKIITKVAFEKAFVEAEIMMRKAPVSYTHLTLPTIYSV